jgi:hypothetical protein
MTFASINLQKVKKLPNLFVFMIIVLTFIVKNILHIFYKLFWKLQFPTYRYMKSYNETYIREGNRWKYYSTSIHRFLDIKPYYKPMFPKAYIK